MNPGLRKKVTSLTNRAVMKRFPKVELHRHLEGTFELKTLYKMAQRNGIEVPDTFAAFKESLQFPRDSAPDFLLFLSKFRNDWYRTYQDVYDIAYASCKKLIEDGIFYIELRFNPNHYSMLTNFDKAEVTKIIIDAGNKAAKQAGFQMRYLITFNRSNQTDDDMVKLYDTIRALDLPEIVGIDLAGDELNYPPEQFKNFFEYVKKDGKYWATIHAGEVTPSSQIWDAIKMLYAKRIGHGTSAINDPELQKFLIKERITLEQCMTSNYQTGSWVDEKNHPLGRLYRLGVPVTINSDDPHIQDYDLTDDYIKAVKFFNFSLEDLIAINHVAIDATFLNDKDKKQLRKAYDKAVANFRTEFEL